MRAVALGRLGQLGEAAVPQRAFGLEERRLADCEERLQLLDELARDVFAGRRTRLERRRDPLQLGHRGLDRLGERAVLRDNLGLHHRRQRRVPPGNLGRRGAVDVVEASRWSPG